MAVVVVVIVVVAAVVVRVAVAAATESTTFCVSFLLTHRFPFLVTLCLSKPFRPLEL